MPTRDEIALEVQRMSRAEQEMFARNLLNVLLAYEPGTPLTLHELAQFATCSVVYLKEALVRTRIEIESPPRSSD